MSQNWQAIKDFYKAHEAEILASRNEWGVDPYAWEAIGVGMTFIERALWSDIRAEGAVFYPQWPVLGFFLDFANPAAKIAIECDGKAYHLDFAKDAARDRALRAEGWRVYRVPGSECVKDAVDAYDEDGNMRCELAPVQKWLRDLVMNHRLRVGMDRKPDNDVWGAA